MLQRRNEPCTRPAASGTEDAGKLALLPSRVREFAAVAARSSHPVLLQGETGVGKTHLARLIHEMSARRDKPFVAVNCGAIPRELFEREMFGHVRGAFTGAAEPAAGLFEAADGGTLSLDEVGELPLDSQPKLLRALEDKSIRRLGATRQTAIDVRIITASNRVLEELVRERGFREDLYYRLCVLEHEVLPLRERRSELAAIARHLLRQNAPAGASREISASALELICAYPWPGNIRELNNALCHALVRSGGEAIDTHHLPDRVRAPAAARGGRVPPDELPRPRYAAPDDERDVILQALQAEGLNRTRTAERLGMSRSTLWAKLRYYRIV
jgi:DNA-binding NtrC family response regulator